MAALGSVRTEVPRAGDAGGVGSSGLSVPADVSTGGSGRDSMASGLTGATCTASAGGGGGAAGAGATGGGAGRVGVAAVRVGSRTTIGAG